MIQSFLAVADGGSLSAAARALGLSQPTVGRHVQLLEDALGLSLFQRAARGMKPTDEALALLEPARAMASSAAALKLAAAGRDSGEAGTVRLTSSVFVAQHLLPPILARFRCAAPEISIELVASDASQNLLFREADIAIRMYRPEQLDIVTSFVGEVAIGAFAARCYLDVHPAPCRVEELLEHDLVGFDRDETIVRAMRAGGLNVSRDDFALRCDHQSIYWQLVCAGGGIGFAQLPVGLADPRVERILPDLPLAALPMWLAAHPRVRHIPRVDRCWQYLLSALKSAIAVAGD